VIRISFENNLAIYSGLDPMTAEGVMLDRVCSLTGIYRKSGFPSVVELHFIGVPGTIVPKEARFSDNDVPANEYILTEDVTIDNKGEGKGIANSTIDAPVFSDIDEIVNVDTPIAGLGFVTNPNPVIPGRGVETDFDLRIRRYKSVALPGTALVDSMYAEIMNTQGVIDTIVYANDSELEDPDYLIPPHSLFVIVFGGDDDDIASSIMKSKSLGSGLMGNTSVQWKDIQGYFHTVKFERPTIIPIYIKVGVKYDLYDESTELDVKNRITEYINSVRTNESECSLGRFLLSDDIYASSFYFPFSGVEYNIASIKVGKSDPATEEIVPIDIFELSQFSETMITVYEVV
jgi:hypothetical protein